MQFLWWVFIGLIVGWQTGKLMKEYGHGLLIDFFMGAAGAVAGGFIMRSTAPPILGGLVLPTLAALAGAAGFTAVAAMASGRKRYA